MAVATARIGPVREPDGTVVGQFPAVVATIGGAWLTLVLVQLSGTDAALHHHALIEGGVPLALAIPVFMIAWQVMVVAMMWPASLHALAWVLSAPSRALRPGLAIAAFLGAFAFAWAAFGLAAFVGDVFLHHVVDAMPWLGSRPWVLDAAVLATAGAYQLTPLKRRSMAACRGTRRGMASSHSTEPSAFRLGLQHGVDCVMSTWALMLLMFADGFGNLVPMVALTGLMAYEVTGRRGRPAASTAGVVLLMAALWVVASPLPSAA